MSLKFACKMTHAPNYCFYFCFLVQITEFIIRTSKLPHQNYVLKFIKYIIRCYNHNTNHIIAIILIILYLVKYLNVGYYSSISYRCMMTFQKKLNKYTSIILYWYVLKTKPKFFISPYRCKSTLSTVGRYLENNNYIHKIKMWESECRSTVQ